MIQLTDNIGNLLWTLWSPWQTTSATRHDPTERQQHRQPVMNPMIPLTDNNISNPSWPSWQKTTTSSTCHDPPSRQQHASATCLEPSDKQKSETYCSWQQEKPVIVYIIHNRMLQQRCAMKIVQIYHAKSESEQLGFPIHIFYDIDICLFQRTWK